MADLLCEKRGHVAKLTLNRPERMNAISMEMLVQLGEALVDAVTAGRRAELQPAPHRPKNAYNLLRLLHSCDSWLRHGEPLIEVTGPLRDTLLAIKRRETPIERVLELAREVAGEIDDAAETSKLPERPDYETADELLRTCRRDAARTASPS